MCLFNQRREADLFSLSVGLATEGQDLSDEVPASEAGLKHLFPLMLHMCIARNVVEHHLRETDNGCQDVVEVMGYAAGEGADGLHLVGLAELLFETGVFLFCPLPFHDVGGL